MKYNEISILLVEDNPDHAELTIKALKRGKLANRICWVKDGEEALQFLLHEGSYANGGNAPRPGLILLDIKLPKVDGLEVLRQVKMSMFSDMPMRSSGTKGTASAKVVRNMINDSAPKALVANSLPITS